MGWLRRRRSITSTCMLDLSDQGLNVVLRCGYCVTGRFKDPPCASMISIQCVNCSLCHVNGIMAGLFS